MSVASNVVKQTAKTALKGNFLKAVIASLIVVFTWILSTNLAGLLEIAAGQIAAKILNAAMLLFLLLPTALGLLRYIWRMLFSACDSPISVFYWFSEKSLYLRAMKLMFNIVLRAAIWLLIFNIPSILLFVLSKSSVFELIGMAPPLWTANLGFYPPLLRNISFVVVFFIMLKYYMAPWLIIADENMEVGEAIFKSSVIARKTSFDFLGLILSSLGWIVLSIFILPQPFTLPLILSYVAVHIRFSVAEYNQHIENLKFTEAGFI
ncbi:MAG: hypothetical protein IJO62_04980 [Clostridia bacterium]|nr:hypothetical protein [Clostridia bacterium]